MSNVNLLGILKTTLKAGVNVLTSPLRFALAVFLDEESDKKIKAKRKLSNEYDHYASVIAKHKRFR
jgi:hypothetical protein